MDAERRHIVRSREIAQMLGHSVGWFYAHRENRERAGFPKKDALLGGSSAEESGSRGKTSGSRRKGCRAGAKEPRR